jgi:hypothetical protein
MSDVALLTVENVGSITTTFSVTTLFDETIGIRTVYVSQAVVITLNCYLSHDFQILQSAITLVTSVLSPRSNIGWSLCTST